MMEFEYHQSNKRQRNCYPIPIISQGDDDDDSMMKLSNSPAAKRFRPCHEAFAMSPGIVSVVDISDCSAVTAMETCDIKKPAVKWWKQASQNQNRQNFLGENDLECHVCGSVYTEEANPKAQDKAPLSQNTMPTNSLLAYFSCKKSTTSSTPPCSSTTMLKARSPDTTCSKASCCTFCERSTCENCFADCEDCKKPFCTFCLKNDYWGSFARVVCSECLTDGSCEEDQDAMNL